MGVKIKREPSHTPKQLPSVMCTATAFIAVPIWRREMYAHAMPRQYTMLVDCPYVIVPLFKCARLNAEWVSKLNPLSTAWCVAENIMLAVINEGLGYSLRIPLNKEHDLVLKELGVPQGWMTPCFIGVGYPKEDELVLEQYDSTPDGHIHMGGWQQ